MRNFRGFCGVRSWEKTELSLEKIEVIEDQKHGQNDIDNHTSQNYNVEHF